MKKKHMIILATLLLAVFGCAKERAALPVDSTPDNADPAVEQGVIVVKFTPEMSARLEKGDTLPNSLGIRSMKRLFPDAGEFEARTRAEGMHRWYTVEYDAPVSATKAAGDMLDLPGVELAETKRKIKNTAIVNDPLYSAMWHIADGKTPTASINVEPVWATYTMGSEDVIVGVVDGGIQTDHPDFEGVVIPGGINGSRNFCDGGFNILPHAHGTHVGGTIGAITNNGIGVCGIAGGNAAAGIKGVRLLSCQIFKEVDGKSVGGNFGAEAIKWAADHGATIVNNSWGYNYDENEDGRLTGDELTKALEANISASDKDAVDYFIKYAGFDKDGNQVGPMAGGVVFFSAGNDGIMNGAPANYPPIVAIGATDQNASRASFSNYGDWVDICAPGVDITSTYVEGKYARMQGTSMACPHVTGVAALLLSYYGGKGFTNSELIDKLLSGANPTTVHPGAQIGPLLDAMGSFSYSSPEAPAPVGVYVASATGNRIVLDFAVTGDSAGGAAYSYLAIASKDRSLVESFDPFLAVPEGVVTSTTNVNGLAVGAALTAYIPGLEFQTDYYVAVYAANYFKRYSAASDILKVHTTQNHPPVVFPIEIGPYVIKASEEKTIAFALSDPDGHSLTVSFEGGSEAADYNYDSKEKTLSVILRGRRTTAGTYNAHIVATDSYGLSSDYEFEYVVLENEPPVAVGSLDDVIAYDMTRLKFDLTWLFVDPEDERITFKVRGNNVSMLKVEVSGSTLMVTPKTYGLSNLTIVAVDAANKECTIPLNILVKNPENPAESYPNPVIDKLTIRTESEADTHVKLVNSNGAVIIDKTFEKVSGFSPLVLDMSSCAPGRYMLTLSYSGKTYERVIVKK